MKDKMSGQYDLTKEERDIIMNILKNHDIDVVREWRNGECFFDDVSIVVTEGNYVHLYILNLKITLSGSLLNCSFFFLIRVS